jgi:hypothetical protein
LRTIERGQSLEQMTGHLDRLDTDLLDARRNNAAFGVIVAH